MMNPVRKTTKTERTKTALEKAMYRNGSAIAVILGFIAGFVLAHWR